MRIHRHACICSLLLAAALPAAHAQTKSRYGTAATQAQREPAAALIPGPVNDGAGFQLICRGGPGLRVAISNVRMASNGPTSWFQVATMTLDFNRSTQPPDRTGRNLQPGQCSPAQLSLRDSDPAQIQDTITAGDAGAWDNSAQAAETRPDSDNIPRYLKNPDHYWSFAAADLGDGYLRAGDSRYWKPEFYKGPLTSATYESAATAAALMGNSATTTQATSLRIGALGTRTQGRFGTPAVPSPAPPVPPPPVVPVPAAVVFSPPLLQDGEQLWACADAGDDQANAGACSGEVSAQAYCRLRDAQSGPELSIADAQPDIPVRAVNGDACAGDACRVVSQLQCDR